MRKSIIICAIASVLALCQACAPATREDSIRLLVGTYTEGNASQGIYLYSFDLSTGRSVQLDTAWAANPSFVIPSADGQRVYSVSEYNDGRQGAVSLSLNGDELTAMNACSVDVTASGADPCNLLLVGDRLITSNYSGGTLTVLPILEDGTLGEATQQFVAEGEGAHMHCAVMSPEGRYVFATDLGGDRIYRFTIAGGDNPLADTEIAWQYDREAHPGPRHMVFSADGRFAYVMCELGDILSVFRYDDGHLEHIGDQLAYDGGGHGSADLHISPDGRFLYTSHRLADDGITVWKLDGEGGAQRVAFVNTGVHPRNFAITPDGRWLLCACRDSDCIMVYAIDPQTGVPCRSGQDIPMPAPVCISFTIDNK